MTNQLVLFDYNTLDSETRIVVQQRTGEIRELMRNTAENIMRVGEKLLEVQVKLGNGQFDSWLQTEFDWSRRTAYNFISVHKRFRGRADFAQIDVATSALYLLAAPSTPDSAVDEILERAEVGEQITHSAAKQTVTDHKRQLSPELPQMDRTAESVSYTQAAEPPAKPTPAVARPHKPGFTPPEPEPAISLDFSTPTSQEEADTPVEVVLTVRMPRSQPGLPETVNLEINAVDGLLRGRFPDFYEGDYSDLPQLVAAACQNYFATESEIINE